VVTFEHAPRRAKCPKGTASMLILPHIASVGPGDDLSHHSLPALFESFSNSSGCGALDFWGGDDGISLSIVNSVVDPNVPT
jgi:hypothetical protein